MADEDHNDYDGGAAWYDEEPPEPEVEEDEEDNAFPINTLGAEDVTMKDGERLDKPPTPTCKRSWGPCFAIKGTMHNHLAFPPTECPMWRRTSMLTSDMLDKIEVYVTSYERLLKEERSWAMGEYMANQAYGEFLFQVNHIEKEGFDTLLETQEAITHGALSLTELSTTYTRQDDKRLESVSCLYRALRHWFKTLHEGVHPPKLSIEEVEKTHFLLLSSTKEEIAGRIRTKDHEIVYVETEEEPGIHVYMWPTEVRHALEDLLKRVELELLSLQEKYMSKRRIEQYLKLGATFFLEFENIHPFMDGNGRCGRILLAYLLQNVMPFPNVLFVDSPDGGPDPPFVNPLFYYDCFQDVQSPQQFEFQDNGEPCITKEAAVCTIDFPRDLTALVIEGVYVGWKRFFRALNLRRIG